MTKDVERMAEQLVRLNACMKELFDKGNVALFTEMNAAIKEIHKIEREADSPAICSVSVDLGIIYENFDMIIAVLRTTEDGVIDPAAQTALNRLLHNIDTSVIKIARAFEIV